MFKMYWISNVAWLTIAGIEDLVFLVFFFFFPELIYDLGYCGSVYFVMYYWVQTILNVKNNLKN